MGDMADYLTEQGEDMWFAHLNGECDREEECQYCLEEEENGNTIPEH